MTDRFTVRSEFENPTYGGDDGVEVMPARMDMVFVLLFVDEHRPRDVERVAVGVEVEEGEIDAAAPRFPPQPVGDRQVEPVVVRQAGAVVGAVSADERTAGDVEVARRGIGAARSVDEDRRQLPAFARHVTRRKREVVPPVERSGEGQSVVEGGELTHRFPQRVADPSVEFPAGVRDHELHAVGFAVARMDVLFQFVTVVDHTRERRVVLQYTVHALVIGLGREVEPPAGRFGEVAERRMVGMLRRRASGRRHPEVGGEADVRRGDFVDVLRGVVVGGPQPAAACDLPVEREARLGRGVAVGGDSPVSLQEIESVAQCGVAREAVRQRNRRGQEGCQFVRVVARPPSGVGDPSVVGGDVLRADAAVGILQTCGQLQAADVPTGAVFVSQVADRRGRLGRNTRRGGGQTGVETRIVECVLHVRRGRKFAAQRGRRDGGIPLQPPAEQPFVVGDVRAVVAVVAVDDQFVMVIDLPCERGVVILEPVIQVVFAFRRKGADEPSRVRAASREKQRRAVCERSRDGRLRGDDSQVAFDAPSDAGLFAALHDDRRGLHGRFDASAARLGELERSHLSGIEDRKESQQMRMGVERCLIQQDEVLTGVVAAHVESAVSLGGGLHARHELQNAHRVDASREARQCAAVAHQQPEPSFGDASQRRGRTLRPDHDAVEPVVARDAVGRHSGCSRIGRGHGVPFLCFGKQEQPAERGGEQQSGQRIRHNGQKKRDAARAVPSSLLAGFRVYFPSMRSM